MTPVALAPFKALPVAQALTVAVLATAGDYLFFEQRAGINFAVFTGLLAIAVLMEAQVSVSRSKPLVSSALICGLAVLALAENISWISVFLAIAGLSGLAAKLHLPWYRDVAHWVHEGARFVFSAPARVFKDVRFLQKRRKRSEKSLIPGGIYSWIVPIAMTIIFGYLFAMANPLMDRFLNSFFSVPDLDVIAFDRLFLWFGLSLIIWPFFSLHVLKARQKQTVWAFANAGSYAVADRLLTPQSVTRSLVMFNILFALQTGFDFTYLWGEGQLPDGMTYASYAHRGAYPLLITVLLAAAFVLVTMHKGAKTEQEQTIRRLVYFWIVQNVLLTLASIDRLWLYVSAYSLTYLRVAAFIWMGLVAIGLVLIMVRLWRNYSNGWLINFNMINLAATLFISAFVNFGGEIAWFNVQQQRPVDVRYLASIGPAALPAIKWLQKNRRDMNLIQLRKLGKASGRLERKMEKLSVRGWRELTWRERRLIGQLAIAETNVQKKITPSKSQDRL